MKQALWLLKLAFLTLLAISCSASQEQGPTAVDPETQMLTLPDLTAVERNGRPLHVIALLQGQQLVVQLLELEQQLQPPAPPRISQPPPLT